MAARPILSASTKTIFKDSPSFHVDPAGRNVYFGVREFGMMAMVNGMAAHGGLIPFGSTFYVFSDYCRPAIRLGALMGVHALYVFTHDSVGLGEDGPTHQPIEHLMSMRAMPVLTDFRPADANETAACWRLALERKGPCFMALSRQDLPVLDAALAFAGVPKGAYSRTPEVTKPDVILIAAGSEVTTCLTAAAELKAAGIAARVVSMPSFRIFDEQTAAYKAALLPEGVPKVSLEAGATMGWWKYVGPQRRGDRDRPVWRIGAGADCDGEAGYQRGECCRAREEAGEEVNQVRGTRFEVRDGGDGARDSAREE